MSLLPYLRRKVFYPLWVAKDRSPRLAQWRELERSQYAGPDELARLQFDRLRILLERACAETRYYRDLFDRSGLEPGDIRTLDDLRRLPVLTRADIRQHADELLSERYDRRGLSVFKTGGSTGAPVVVLKDREAVEIAAGASLRAFTTAGWRLGEPWGMVWGNPVYPATLKERLRSLLIDREIYLDTMNLTDERMLAFVREWRRVRPTILRGHSHSIYVFAAFCRRQGITEVRPNAIISSSMMLIPSERRVIEAAFGCPVTDLYGCEEVGLIAYECERHAGMHVNVENVLVEILDAAGRPAAPGEVGEIVVTSLINHAMPLVRYRIGDMASFTGSGCACGRTLPMMTGVAGRVADFLVRKDGSIVAGVSLVERTLTAHRGVAQMQIIQEDMDHLTLRLVKDVDFTDSALAAIVAELGRSVGEHNRVNVEFVTAIPAEKSGKYRFAISRVPNPFSQ
ncbi:MAG: phenylacetate--CoA ligase family protein [Gammaproteobacteria bacterium]|nr:phenylacetate--CoA ligase family protein [Gammaproteobacteria bacterium]